MPVIIFEGCDKVGKTTHLRQLSKNFIPFVSCDMYNIRGINNETQRLFQMKNILLMFDMIKSMPNTWFLFSRSHLGEYVYGNIYRNYNADYIFSLEKLFVDTTWFKKSVVIYMYDAYEHIINDEDGNSLHKKDKKLFDKEHNLFMEVMHMTYFKTIIINRNNRDFDIVHNEINDKLFGLNGVL